MVLFRHFGINSFRLVIPIAQRTIELPDHERPGKTVTVEFPEELRIEVFPLPGQDAAATQAVDAAGNTFRITCRS